MAAHATARAPQSSAPAVEGPAEAPRSGKAGSKPRGAGNAAQQEGLRARGPFGDGRLNAALSQAFGRPIDHLTASTSGAGAGLGADAWAEGTALSFDPSLSLTLDDAAGAERAAHEVAHALAPAAAPTSLVDQPGDPGERSADASGKAFGRWVAGGARGAAPSLKPAAGGRAEIHRHGSAGSVRTITGRPPLQRGDSGPQVERLQTLLNLHGATLSGTGFFGPQTEAAVRTFQAKNGLDVDGIAGGETVTALNRPARDAHTNNKEAATYITGDPSIRFGQSGGRVKTLQALLNQHGASLPVTGYFGPQTETAVRDFQKRKGLEVDGWVGPQTAAALNGQAPRAGGGPARAPAPEGPGARTPPAPGGGQGDATGGTGGAAEIGNADPRGVLNQSKLNPSVKKMTRSILATMQAEGYKPYLFEGFRSFERQNDLFAGGKGVTKVRGGGSWHNYGLAVDIVFYNARGSGPSWDAPKKAWNRLGAVGKAAGFTQWGGDWGWDMPHFQYHPGVSSSAYDMVSTYNRGGIEAVWGRLK
jgi:peptidoglycan hydrolase-like protein with peptidoglycan-binding domain